MVAAAPITVRSWTLLELRNTVRKHRSIPEINQELDLSRHYTPPSAKLFLHAETVFALVSNRPETAQKRGFSARSL